MSREEIEGWMSKKPVKKGYEVAAGPDGAYLAEDESKKVYVVSFAAYVVWSMCDGDTTVQTMVERIAEGTELSHEEIKPVLIEILNALSQANLLSIP